MITKSDLPNGLGCVVMELDDGATLRVEKRAYTFYGASESFDVEDNEAMFLAKINSWGARVIGCE